MVSRRRFIFTSILAAAGASTGIYLYRSNSKIREKQLIDNVISELSKLPGAVLCGQLYSMQITNNNLPLVSLSGVRRKLRQITGDIDYENIAEVLDKQIQMDLQANQLIQLDGWYFTQTEAELCKLAADYEYCASHNCG